MELDLAPTESEPLQRLDSQLCFALYSVTNAVGRTYAPLLEALGITYSQYIVLLVLWERDDVSVGAIGKRLFLDSGTLTPLLKRLEQAGLIERRRDAVDERQVRIRLTPHGNALQAKARTLPRALRCAMGRESEELAALRDDLLRLRTSLMASLDGATSQVSRPSAAVVAGPQAIEPASALRGRHDKEGENNAR